MYSPLLGLGPFISSQPVKAIARHNTVPTLTSTFMPEMIATTQETVSIVPMHRFRSDPWARMGMRVMYAMSVNSVPKYTCTYQIES